MKEATLNTATQDYSAWIGREERITEELSLFPVTATLATLDDEKRKLGPGDALPPLWHWFYFLPRVAASISVPMAIPSVADSCLRSHCRGACSPARG